MDFLINSEGVCASKDEVQREDKSCWIFRWVDEHAQIKNKFHWKLKVQMPLGQGERCPLLFEILSTSNAATLNVNYCLCCGTRLKIREEWNSISTPCSLSEANYYGMSWSRCTVEININLSFQIRETQDYTSSPTSALEKSLTWFAHLI